MRREGSLVVRWGILLACAGLLFLGSSRPIPPEYVPRIPHIDKLAHLVAYGLLAMLCFRALWPVRDDAAPLWVLLFGAALATAYGAAMEFYQDLVSRHFDWLDMAANGVGAALAAALWEPLTHRYDWLK